MFFHLEANVLGFCTPGPEVVGEGEEGCQLPAHPGEVTPGVPEESSKGFMCKL